MWNAFATAQVRLQGLLRRLQTEPDSGGLSVQFARNRSLVFLENRQTNWADELGFSQKDPKGSAGFNRLLISSNVNFKKALGSMRISCRSFSKGRIVQGKIFCGFRNVAIFAEFLWEDKATKNFQVWICNFVESKSENFLGQSGSLGTLPFSSLIKSFYFIDLWWTCLKLELIAKRKMKLHALLWIHGVQIIRVAKKRIFKEPLEVSFDFRKLTMMVLFG